MAAGNHRLAFLDAGHEATAVRIREFQPHLLVGQNAQRFQQIRDIEANFHRLAMVVGGQEFLRFLLFGIVRPNDDTSRLQPEPNATKFFVGQNRGAR